MPPSASGGAAVSLPVNAHAASASRFGPRALPPVPRARASSASTQAATSASVSSARTQAGTSASASVSASVPSHDSGAGARASVSISTNASTISASSVPSRSKNSWFVSPILCSTSTRAGVAGTSECTRRSTRVAALSHRPDARSASSDHVGDAIRFSTVPCAVTGRSRSGASASSTGPASRFGSMTSAAPTRPRGARASAAHTGRMAEALLPEPVSPSTSVWRVSSARGTTPCGGYSARHCGTASPRALAFGLGEDASSRPTRSTRRNVRASVAEMVRSGSASRR